MPEFELEQTGSTMVLRLNRAAKRNAINYEMLDQLQQAITKIDRDQEIRAVVLTGTDDNFCAGGDIKAWSGLSAAEFGNQWLREGHAVFDALARLRQPVIAAINGHALGGGLELAACADYRIAEAQTRFGLPEAGLGIIPGWSGTQRTVRRFGSQVVRRMAIFGEIFDASTAQQLGIVDQVVEAGQSATAAREFAGRLQARGPQATELIKMLLNAAEGEEQERVLEVIAGRVAAQTADLAEGVAAFAEKRAPRFGQKEDEQ